ncbi:MAG: hypothetical protein IAE83_02415 [Anaerolinea sp.]|nr:hypothetical protein [Anaerolinea sp.]MCC6973986.1 hypothetical protein [Anaerolineae bacterium]CAG1008593.1 hypothetical protein ANRL4_03908 [Anaerolineae bacterium]
MTTAEERMKILDMIREGKISSDEGARLLQALQQGAKRAENQNKGREPRWLRIRVMDVRANKAKVNVSLPMSLVDVGIKLGARFIPADQDSEFTEVLEAIRRGQMGKVFEYEDRAEGEKVEVWVE